MLAFLHSLHPQQLVSRLPEHRDHTNKLDTLVQEGEIPVRLDKSGAVVEKGRKRETREFNGRTFLMEHAIEGDVAIMRAWKADKDGNCVFRYVRHPNCILS